MPLISEQIIDEIQARMDIAELIGRYVPLKRAGRQFKALCPFHKEKTPSFAVNIDKQVFHCFGCGIGGNIFSFLMHYERMTFPEAVRQLAGHVGIDVPEREVNSGNEARERLRDLIEKICSYFERTLAQSKQSTAARAYVRERGVSERTQRSFRLGHAPAGWNRLLTVAKGQGISTRDLEAAGLVIQGRSGYYDRFRNRLMFSIADARGRVVGFGGRSLDGQEPKYLNSPETVLYTKGRHLFGLAQAKENIIETKVAVVVEGYFDCIVLVDAGFTNAVSPLGTALTSEQASLLKRYAETVILAFDADYAGENATLRGIDLLIEKSLTVRVAVLPTGLDPDECIRKIGQEGFQRILESSADIIEFLIEAALKRYPERTTEGKVKAAQFVLPTIAMVSNAMLRSEYVRRLAGRLNLDEESVIEELGKTRSRSSAVSYVAEHGRVAAHDGGSYDGSRVAIAHGAERMLTALVLDEPSRWQKLRGEVALDDVVEPRLRRILEVVNDLMTKVNRATPAQVVSRLSEKGEDALVTELVEFAQSVTAKDEVLLECIRRVQAVGQKHKLAQMRERIRAAQNAGSEADIRHLLEEYQKEIKGA